MSPTLARATSAAVKKPLRNFFRSGISLIYFKMIPCRRKVFGFSPCSQAAWLSGH